MLAAIIAGLLLAVVCVLVHYEVLRALWRWAPHTSMPPRRRLTVVILGAYLGHLVEVLIFAVGLLALVNVVGLQTSDPTPGISFDRAIYYSIESFTSLGSSSTLPKGPLRLFAGMEGIIGLLLIGWSTSFTYLAMREYWDLHHKRGRTAHTHHHRPEHSNPT